jgi:heme/copper-type cytochrome/quinol oxidase subunit 3
LAREKESFVPVLLSFWILLTVPSLFLRLGEGRPLSFFLRRFGFVFVLIYWVLVIIKEAGVGSITGGLKRVVRFAFILFIGSEVAFFASFFWGFYTFSFIPTLEIGGVWPQERVGVIDGFGVPLLNTVILLRSGVSVTWAHKALLHAQSSVIPLATTLLLGSVFLVIQISEYASASFSIADGVYGSVFFLLTGFHGFHVLVGCLMLAFSLVRAHSFSKVSHVGFECAAWYWHFVDVVWLFLFSFVYLWSQGLFSHLSESIGTLW